MMHREHRNESCKKYYKKNRQKQRDYSLKMLYGITAEEKNSMAISQKNRCKICGKRFKNHHDRSVDHCHKTGRVRGILCRNCNSALGYFCDDINVIQRAVRYMRKYN